MILGFAHITKNVPKLDGGWLTVNAPEKWPLMERRAVWHSLMVQRDGIPEEMVEYDTGVVDQHLNRLDVEDVGGGRILLGARDTDAEIKFFRDGLGFYQYPSGVICFISQLPSWRIGIAVQQDASAPIDQPLDIAGYAALAFYSSDAEVDRDKAIAAGGRVPTDPFTVKLDRKMKVVMLRSPEGTIIELIEVLK